MRARHELFDDTTQQPIQLILDFVLNGRQKAKVDEIELITRLRLTQRFRAMNGLWPPALRISLEQLGDRVQADPLEQSRSALRADAPDTDVLLPDREQDRRPKRSTLEKCPFMPFEYHPESGRSVGFGDLRERRQVNASRFSGPREDIREGVVTDDRFRRVTKLPELSLDGE